jgi:hypothetical protein
MTEPGEMSLAVVLERIRAQAAAESMRITQHAQQEMAEEDITLEEVLQAIAAAHILASYPEHRRGPCCLLNGLTRQDASCISCAQQHSQC